LKGAVFLANIKMAVEELHKAFYLLNKHKFNSELLEPAILIQTSGKHKNAYGWCSVDKIWSDTKKKEHRHEITICAEYLNRPLYNLMSTLLHEMVHLHNILNEIKDVSRGNTYHNKKFKETAEARGLIISFDKKIGWSISELNQDTKVLIDTFNLNQEAFTIARRGEEIEGKTKKKSSMRKYTCPECGTIIRATKEVNVICADCDVPFQLEETEDDE
jgi:rubrerythrin